MRAMIILCMVPMILMFSGCSKSNPANDDRAAPVITQQPQSQTVTVGDSVTFTVTATGTQPMSNVWRKNGIDISFVSSDSFTISSVQLADAGTYSVVVSNSEGSVTSSGALLIVLAKSVLCTDSIAYPLYQDTLATMTCYQHIGPITIGSADPFIEESLKVSDTVSLPAGAFDSTVNVPLSGIQTVVFDTNSSQLPVTVRNLSAATVSNLSITVFDSVRNIGALGPDDSATLLFPVVGRDSVLDKKVGKGITAGTLSGVRVRQDSAAPGGANVAVTFDFNGLTADEASMLNYYVSFSKSFVKYFDLGDSLEIHYFDILDGYIKYGQANYTDLHLRVNVTLRHLWGRFFCEVHSPAALESVADFRVPGTVTWNDSFGMFKAYFGANAGTLLSDPHGYSSDSSLNYINLSADRLFPEWIYDSADMRWKSAAPVEFLVTPYPEAMSRIVSIKSTDSLEFAFAASRLKYREMLATVRQEYVMEGDTAKAAVLSPWNAPSRDTSGKKVWTDISFIPRLPVSFPHDASFDTLGIRFTLFSPATPPHR